MANELTQSSTVLTNELRLHDWHSAKMSMTFGESDQDGEYCYLNVKYKANEEKFDFIVDRETINFAGPKSITLNNYKIWHENNDGPNSGLNADLLDGRHATEFKDRYGYHHFLHMFLPPTVAPKHFVKIATFTTRKVGDAPNFKGDGTPPYDGVFAYSGNGVMGVSTDDTVVHGGNLNKKILTSLAVQDAKKQFKVNTVARLDDHEPDLFHSTNMLTEGIYNGTLRGSVSILKGRRSTTFDFHVGLFEDPLCTEKDGWEAVDKYFYVSLHDETLPFITENWDLSTGNDPNHSNPGIQDGDNVNMNTDDINKENGSYHDGYPNYPTFPGSSVKVATAYAPTPRKVALDQLKAQYNNDVDAALTGTINKLKSVSGADSKARATSSRKAGTLTKPNRRTESNPVMSNPNPDNDHTHTRPEPDTSNYKVPPATFQDEHPYDPERMREPFPADNDPAQRASYQQYLDIMRLYHTGSRTDLVDGVEVDTHIFDLYICVDEKMEVRVQPFVSSACLLYNFQKPVQEADLPQRKFIRPKSIYDNRYAHVKHRHYDLEKRIWQLTLEANEIWKNFSNYLTIDQGIGNAKKVMMTNEEGKIYAADDNFERHAEPTSRRVADRVIVSKLIDGMSCIVTSKIKLSELNQLQGVRGNIQKQIDDLWDAIDEIWDDIDAIWDEINDLSDRLENVENQMDDFVKKAGDAMTGSLHIQYDGKTYADGELGPKPETFSGVKFFNKSKPENNGGYLYGASEKSYIGFGVQKTQNIDTNGDWAVVVTKEIDSQNSIACQFNGTALRFCSGGRNAGASDPGRYFYIDFADLYEKVYGVDPLN